MIILFIVCKFKGGSSGSLQKINAEMSGLSMAAGLSYNYAAKQVDDEILKTLAKLAEETQLTEKFEALYNGEVINTGEKRMVLHKDSLVRVSKVVPDLDTSTKRE